MSVAAVTQAAASADGKKNFPALIDQLKRQVALALPKHLNADRMARIALTAFHQNPQLKDCDPRSVFASVVVASQMGLEPGVQGQGYLIPYKTTCTFVPGWRGLVDLAQRSGRSSVWTGAVFQGDEFDYDYGSNPHVNHKPCGEDDAKLMTHTYAIGRIRGAEYPVIEVWPVAKIWRHRDRFNKVGSRHYSFNHPEMYARKVPLLQVLKYMPSSIEMARAEEVEAASETGQEIDLQRAIDGSFSVSQTPEQPQQAEAKQEGATQTNTPPAGESLDV